MSTGSGSERPDETPAERADRNFSEVMQELRVAQTGVQVLFAFLLSLPFLAEFPSQQRTVAVTYTAALLCAAAAAIAFIAPVASHRLHFREGRKEQVVWLAHSMSLVGLALLVAAMVLGVWLVMQILWSPSVGVVLGALVVLAVLMLWIVIPARILRRGSGKP